MINNNNKIISRFFDRGQRNKNTVGKLPTDDQIVKRYTEPGNETKALGSIGQQNR